MRLLLTGGCGFIGSAVVRRLIRSTDHSVVNVDKLTYAASEEALEETRRHRRHTLIATDGTLEIRTPHDECLLVMPSLRPSRGHTAVRLARFVDCHAAA